VIPSSSNDLGPFSPECFEFRLAPDGVSEYVMSSYCLGVWFVFTSHERVMSPQMCDCVLDVLCKLGRS